MIKTILLHKDLQPIVNSDDRFNIILSSEFYWVRLFDIPIRSKKDVLVATQNLFEDFFDTTDYKFYSIKIEEFKYLCFAYKEQDIINKLEQLNIDIKKVDNLYFAQNEFKNFAQEKSAIKCEDNFYIYQNDILVKLPLNISAMMSSNDINLQNIELSKHKFSINRSSKYIDNKSAYILSIIFILFSVGIFFKTYTTNNIIKQYDIKKENLKTKYHLMSSTIQTKSVLKEYEKVIQKNNNTRQTLQYAINFKQKVAGRLDKLEFNNGNLNIDIIDSNLQHLKNYFSKKYKINSATQHNKIVKIGFKL